MIRLPTPEWPPAWQQRGNTRPSICVRCVRETVLLGRCGRFCKYLAGLYEVEGLVGLMPRGGSGPLERMVGPGIARLGSAARRRASSGGRAVAWQPTVRIHAVDDGSGVQTAMEASRPEMPYSKAPVLLAMLASWRLTTRSTGVPCGDWDARGSSDGQWGQMTVRRAVRSYAASLGRAVPTSPILLFCRGGGPLKRP